MNADWLARLAPAHTPAAPGWWPPAPGWWGVALLGVLLAAAALWWWREPRRVRRRAALKELSSIRTLAAGDAAASARAIESLLRRYAMAVFGRARVASLSGQEWLGFAAAHGATGLAGDTGRALLQAAFGGAAADQRAQWLAAAEGFVRHARRERERAGTTR
jgi:hypothetical protein